MAAQEVFHQLMYQLRSSNLNFILSETPYSAQILLRKRFLKEASGPSSNFSSLNQNHDTELQNKNDSLAKLVQDLSLSNESSKETVNILEDKIAKIEAEAMKNYKDSSDKVDTLKGVIKNHKIEIENIKKDLKLENKTVKEKSKEIFKLEQKCENLQNNVKNFKLEISTLKSENKKIVKKTTMKPTTTKTISTNTPLPSSASVSTSTSSFSFANAPTNNNFDNYLDQNVHNPFSPSLPSTSKLGFPSQPSSIPSPALSFTSTPPATLTCSSTSSSAPSSSLGFAACTSGPSSNSSSATTCPKIQNHPWNNTPLLIPEPDSSFSSLSSSMVSHWIPSYLTIPQSPGSITTMVNHCAKLPSPGSKLLSMQEVLEALRECFKISF